jgi:hypothetical protein
MRKFIKDLKIGDVVRAHGGVFRVIENAHESQGHRPQSAARAVCIEGRIPGYFAPGSIWTFQGNLLAPRVTLAV